jgi:TonB family protein
LIGFLAALLLAAADAPRIERALERYYAPEYPAVSLRERTEGQVACQLFVDPSGAVTAFDIAQGSDAELSAAVSAAVRNLRFAPGPATVMSFVFRFALEPEFVIVPGLLAVNGSVEVEVREAGTRVPVPGATVVAVGLASGGITDGRGVIRLTLPAGEERLLVATPEHSFLQEPVTVAPGETASTTVYLYRTRPGQFSAVIPGERHRDSAAPTQITREEVRNVPGTNEDPLRVVELLPGVARAPFLGGQLLVRGARPEDTGAYINGQRIPILYHLLNGPSVVSESAIDRIDFLAGGAGAYYGRNLAGIVSVLPRTTRPDGWHGLVAADLKKSSVFLEAPAGDHRQFFVAGRLSYQNPLENAFLTDDQKRLPVPRYRDYQVGYRQRLESGNTMGALLFGSEDSLFQSEEGRGLSIATRDQSIGFHRLQLLGNFALSPTTSLSVTPLLGYDRSIDRSSGTPGLGNAPPQARDTRTVAGGLRSELSYKPGPGLDLRGGIDASYDDVRYRFDQEETQDIAQLGATSSERKVRDGVQQTLSLGQYVETSFDLGKVRVTPGLRLDVIHWNGHTRTAVDPRLWGRIPVWSGQAFAYAGLYHQAPQPIELDPNAGNPDLGLESAVQTGIGLEQRWQEWTGRIEAFYQRRSDLVFPATPAESAGTISNPHFSNSGIARSYGIEVLLRKHLGRYFYGWISYTLSKTEEIPRAGDPWQPGAFDQTQILNLVLALRFSTQVEVSARLRYATGNPDRHVVGAIFDSTAGRYVPVAQPLGSERVPAFTQLDIEVNNIWTADLYRLTLYVDLENLMNRRNGEFIARDYRFQQEDVIPGPPLNAALGARVTF